MAWGGGGEEAAAPSRSGHRGDEAAAADDRTSTSATGSATTMGSMGNSRGGAGGKSESWESVPKVFSARVPRAGVAVDGELQVGAEGQVEAEDARRGAEGGPEGAGRAEEGAEVKPDGEEGPWSVASWSWSWVVELLDVEEVEDDVGDGGSAMEETA